MKIAMIGNVSTLEILKRRLEKYDIECIIIDHIKDRKSRWKVLSECDVLYGTFADLSYKNWLMARLMHKKTVNHWIGSDVYRLMHDKKAERINRFTRHIIQKQVAVSEGLIDELKGKGIQAELLPILPDYISFNLSKMPEKHAILMYFPEGSEDFYRIQWMYRLAEDFTELSIIIVGNDGKKLKQYKNIEYAGKIDIYKMNELYDRISVLIRTPLHDGLPKMVLEALAKGKYVISNQKLPCCLFADSYEKVKAGISELIKKAPEINCEGHRFAVQYMDQKKNTENFIKLFKSI